MTIRRYFQLVGMYVKMDMATLMRDTGFMLICVVSDVCAHVSSIFGIFLLAWKFGGIGGLDKYEILFMLAYASIAAGVLALMGGCNALFPSRIIGRGQWEHMFIMPLPYFVQLTVGAYPFTGSSKLISGVFLMWFAVSHLAVALPWWWIFQLIIYVGLSMIVMVGLSYLFSSLAFYAPVQCEEISSAVIHSLDYTSTFPLSGMPLYVRAPLLSIFPAGLIAWLPTLIILGKATVFMNIYPFIFAVLLTCAASYFFRKGFQYYVKKGINRYASGGHRN